MNRITNNLIALFTGFSLLLGSCMSAEKSIVSCPDFSKNAKFEARNSYKNHTNKKIVLKGFRIKGRKDYLVLTKKEVISSELIKCSYETGKELNPLQAHLFRDNSPLIVLRNPSIVFSALEEKIERNQSLVQKNETKLDCDIIILKNGDEIEAKDIVIGVEVVNYKLCDIEENTVLSADKTEVLMIKYADGSKKVISPTYQQVPVESKKTEGLGIAGFVSSLVGFWIFGIPLGILAVVFGIISLGKINRNPTKFKGKGYAITAIILGLIDVIGVLIILGTI